MIGEANRVEQSSDAECGGFAGKDRLSEGRLHEGLCCEVVDLVGLVVSHDVDHRNLVEEVAGDEFEVVLEVTDPLEVQGGTASNHSDDVVTLGQKELGQVGAVLSSDSCDECSFAHCVIPLGEWGHRPWSVDSTGPYGVWVAQTVCNVTALPERLVDTRRGCLEA